MTKRASFAIFARSIVNNLHVCLLQQYKCLYTTRHTDQISVWPFLTFSSVAGKNWPLSRSYFGSLEHALVTVAVVERFKQQPMYGLSNGTKESGLCREVAVCWGSTVSLEWRQSWLGFDFIWSIIKDPLKYRANKNTKQRKFLKLLLWLHGYVMCTMCEKTGYSFCYDPCR